MGNSTSNNISNEQQSFLPGDLVQLIAPNLLVDSEKESWQQEQQYDVDLFRHTFVVVNLHQDLFVVTPSTPNSPTASPMSPVVFQTQNNNQLYPSISSNASFSSAQQQRYAYHQHQEQRHPIGTHGQNPSLSHHIHHVPNYTISVIQNQQQNFEQQSCNSWNETPTSPIYPVIPQSTPPVYTIRATSHYDQPPMVPQNHYNQQEPHLHRSYSAPIRSQHLTLSSPARSSSSSNSIPITSEYAMNHSSYIKNGNHRMPSNSLQLQASRCDYITIQSVIDHRILYCPPSHLKLLKNNHANRRRRIEYGLAQQYVQACKSMSIKPSYLILDLYGHHIKCGEALTVLDLSGNAITDAHVLPITRLLKMGSAIRRLNLSNNRLTGYGCEYISECLGNVKSLKELDLSNNMLKIQGAVYLARGLKFNRSLNLLNLSNTQIGSEGCNAILNAILANNNSSIIKLDLRYDGVEDNQIALLLQIARKHRCFCFVQVYPAYAKQPNNEGSEEDDRAWLSYEGWINHSQLNSVISSNIKFLKENPSYLKIHSDNNENSLDYFSVGLSILKDEFISPFLGGNSNTKDKKESDSNPRTKNDDWVLVTQNRNSSASSKLTNDPDLLYLYSSGRERRSSNASSTLEYNSSNDVPATCESATSSSVDNEPMIECKICLDAYPVSNIYILDNCNHKFCLNCLQQYVSIKINNGEVDSIRCPDICCKCGLSVSEIKQLSEHFEGTRGNKPRSSPGNNKKGSSLFDKFERIALQKALSQMGDLVYCPNSLCGNAMIVNDDNTPDDSNWKGKQPMEDDHLYENNSESSDNNPLPLSEASSSTSSSHCSPTTPTTDVNSSTFSDNGMTRRIRCTNCQMVFCRLCKKKWHEGLSCAENELKQQDEQEEQFKKWMEHSGNVKHCPKCNITIQKHRGCNSMKCGNCSQQFCWFCGTMFDAADEKAHFKNCHRWSLFGINI